MAKLSSRTFIISLVIVIILGAAYFSQSNGNQLQSSIDSIQSKIDSFDATKVNSCEVIMQQQNLPYTLCTTLPNQDVVLHDSNLDCGVQTTNIQNCGVTQFDMIFNPGDYLGVQVNLQKINNFYTTYYACAYSTIPIYETVYPIKYGNSTAHLDTSQQFFCTPLYNENDYHHLALSGFVLNAPGQYVIMKVWIFDGSLGQINFRNNLAYAKLVVDLEGEVR